MEQRNGSLTGIEERGELPWWLSSKETARSAGDLGLIPGLGRSLGWEDPLEKGTATHSSILAGEFHGQRSLAGYTAWGRKEQSQTRLIDFHFQTKCTLCP